MKNFLHHLFVPRESNNHRAKLLHHSSIFSIIVFLFVGIVFVPPLKTHFPGVLGIKIDISTQDLLTQTNQKRAEQNAEPLVLNNDLSLAAKLKGEDMLARNYWAHNAPDGTTPWYFIKKVGYSYTYAGENLARGFNNTHDVVAAWMASPTHRENMLSKNYHDIGFAVLTGKLDGEETVLIVEMFGNTNLPVVAKQNSVPQTLEGENNKASESVAASAVKNTPFINVQFFSQNIAFIILILFIGVFLLDMVVVQKRKIIRLVGHNTDHILFLGAILLIIIIISRGLVL